jgi:membrane-associated phospholipid phosphatase
VRPVIASSLLAVGLVSVHCGRDEPSRPSASKAVLPASEPEIHRAVLDPVAALDGAPTRDALGIERDRLTFSSTMEWSAEVAFDLPAVAPYLGSDEALLVLPPPPSNSSERTRAEVAVLRRYQAARTPALVDAIKREADGAGLQLGGITVAAYAASTERPNTARAVRDVLREVSPIVLRFKRKFDRIRPHRLEPTLQPVIDVPGHPAYPSGHSTQAHIVAYLLAELAPRKRAVFERDALRVAVHREIAGVHYPSDTAAGALLARQVLDRMLRKDEFARVIEKARAEWITEIDHR